MADKEKNSKTTDIKDSQAGVVGDGTNVGGDIHLEEGDRITVDGRDIAVSKDEGIAAIIKNLVINLTGKPLVTSATVLLFILVLVIIGIAVWVWSVPPRFAIENPVLRSDASIIIKADNWKADKNEPLDVEFDDVLFRRKGIPSVPQKISRRSRGFLFFLIMIVRRIC